jgi:tetratricopeptide (TPR) repeat protein
MSRARRRFSPRPSSPLKARSSLRPWLLLALVVAVATGAFVWWGRSPAPEVPSLAEYGEMDRDVRAFIAEHLAAVASAPNHADSWRRLGLASEANGFVGLAARAYRRATELDPRAARTWYRLALVDGRLGDHASAMAALDRSLAVDSSYPPAHWRRGLWLLDAADLAGAQIAFERAVSVGPSDPGGSLGLARLSLARGENAAAVATLERLLEERPGNRYALQLLGTAYRRLGRTDDAQFALAVGVRGEPQWPDPWSDEVALYRRGFAATLKEATGYALDGHFDRAIPLLERLHRERPDDVGLQTHLGGIYVAGGRADDGIRTLEAVVGRDPTNFDAHLSLATAYLLAKSHALAARHADRALALRPTSASALETQGMILWQTQRPQEALAMLRSALERDPRRSRPRVWIGLIHVEQGRAREAVADFEMALSTDPVLVDALAGLAMAYARLGAMEQADLALRRGAQINPASPRLQQARAYVEQRRR